MRIVKKCLSIITSSILIVLICFSVYTFLSLNLFKNNYVNIFGYTYFAITTGSMSPTIDVNDIIVVKLDTTYKENDIITYQSGNSFITHRIISINDDKFVTKGDANNTEDSEVLRNQIVGKVQLIVSTATLLKILGVIILFFLIVSVINFENIFKKFIGIKKEEEDSPLEFTQKIQIVPDDTALVDNILAETVVISPIETNLLELENIILKKKKKNVSLKFDKEIIRDIIKILELKSANKTKITRDGAVKLKYLYNLANTISLNSVDTKNVIENITFKEKFDYEFEDIGLSKALQIRLYEMPIYVYLLLLTYCVIYDNDDFFDALYKILKFRIVLDVNLDFVNNNYKVDKVALLISQIISKLKENESFELDKIVDLIKANKNLHHE